MKVLIKNLLAVMGLELKRFDHKRHIENLRLFEKYKSFTMIRLADFEANLNLVSRFSHIGGDYVECGVWRGGMSAAISEMLGPDRRVHLFDSFEGLPAAKEIDGEDALKWQKSVNDPGYFNNCAAEVGFVEQAMRLAGNSNYAVYPGWFADTLPHFEPRSVGILRLDGDWYDSIMTSLIHLFPMVVKGGLIILDDYGQWDGCSRAVHKYLADTNSPSRIEKFSDTVSYIVKK